jgi:integrase
MSNKFYSSVNTFLDTLNAPSTRRAYAIYLHQFELFRKTSGQQMVSDVLKWVDEQFKTPSTRALAASAISKYLAYKKNLEYKEKDGKLHNQEMADYIARQNKLSKEAKQIDNKEYLSYEKILEKLADVKYETPNDFKYVTAVKLYGNIPLRGDWLMLKKEQYDAETGIITIGKCLKTGKEIEPITLSPEAKEILDKYIEGEKRDCGEYIFHFPNGDEHKRRAGLLKNLQDWSLRKLGVKIGENYLRKIIVNGLEEEIKDLPVVEKNKRREDLAAKMAHSVSVQQQNYVVDNFKKETEYMILKFGEVVLKVNKNCDVNVEGSEITID